MMYLRSDKPRGSGRNSTADTLLFLALSLVITVSVRYAAACEEPEILTDKSVRNISLAGYNVSNPDGESLDELFVIKPESSCLIQIVSVPRDVSFIVVQVHGFLKNITLSYYRTRTRETSITGENVGLVLKNSSRDLSLFLWYESYHDDADIMISVQAYGTSAPIPGGCNMEFQVETSPFLRVLRDEAITKIDFAPAEPLSLTPLTEFPFLSPDPCNIKPNPIAYRMYRLYLPEGEFSKDLYFSSIKMMLTKGRVVKNGRKIPDKYGSSHMRYNFATYPGIGSVFVVVAETDSGTAVYVPAFSYSCENGLQDPDCRVLDTAFSKFLCASVFFLGLFACFAAHRFFKIQLLLLGFLSGSVVTYAAAQHFLDESVVLIASVGVGSMCGIAFIVVWCFRGLPLLSLVIATTILGFLNSSILFYKIIDFFELFESDVNYWSIFASVTLLTPVLMVSLSEKANIISCAVVGAFATVVSIDYYIGSNIRFILLNVIRRATLSRFRTAIIDPPFQAKDRAIIWVWIVLATAGIIVQMLLIRGKPPYPPPFNPFKKLIKWFTAPPPPSTRIAPTERTPLLRATA